MVCRSGVWAVGDDEGEIQHGRNESSSLLLEHLTSSVTKHGDHRAGTSQLICAIDLAPALDIAPHVLRL